MPVVLRYKEFGGTEARFRLQPDVRLARNDGFDARTLRELIGLVEANRVLFEVSRHEYFGQGA
jgi:hypothetical protein